MSIIFQNTMIHSLDLTLGQVVLSATPLKLDDKTEAFICKHLNKILDDTSLSEAKLQEAQTALVSQFTLMDTFSAWSYDVYIAFCEAIAHRWYKYMQEYETIPSGDLCFTEYMLNDTHCIACWKFDYQEGIGHAYNHKDNTNVVETNSTLYKSKVSEGFVYNFETKQFYILDKSKSQYMQLMLEMKPDLSTSDSVAAINTVAEKVIANHYDNGLNAEVAFKNAVSESIARTAQIDVDKVFKEVFGSEDEDVTNDIQTELEIYGINNAVVPVADNKIANKYNNTTLKTDTGVTIKVPTHLLKDPDFIEIIKEENGTTTIKIRNVSQIITK